MRVVEGSREYFHLKCCIKAFSQDAEPYQLRISLGLKTSAVDLYQGTRFSRAVQVQDKLALATGREPQVLELSSLSAYICAVKQLMSSIACLALCAFPGPLAPAAAEKQPVVVVRGPTVVAFFEPVTQAKLEKDPDTNEAFADFQLYATNVRGPLKKAGINFHELYVRSFRLQVGSRLTTFHPVKMYVGYYLVAPGKKPQIEYGVMTDADLLKVAKEYFGPSGK